MCLQVQFESALLKQKSSGNIIDLKKYLPLEQQSCEIFVAIELVNSIAEVQSTEIFF
jgi:hypothetical protein